MTTPTKKRTTPESSWIAHARLNGLPEMDWGPPGHIVVVAPHPDDETLALGGTLHWLAQTGWRATLIGVTDGGASHPYSTTTTAARMMARRVEERSAALARLGLAQARVVRLGVPDGGVASYPGLSSRIAELLSDASWCVAPFRLDGHPDHDATGTASADAAAKRGVRFAEYPVWAWHWARPDSDEMPWGRARRISLDTDARRAKLHAIDAYTSQTAPLSEKPEDVAILDEAMLAHFNRRFEVVFA